MAPTSKPLRIAIIFEEVQYSDISPMDLLSNISTQALEKSGESPFPNTYRVCQMMACAYSETMSRLSPEFPEFFSGLIPNSTPMEFLFVSSSLEPAGMTPIEFRAVPTHTYESCPRDVDVMLIGGPMMRHRPEGSLRLFREVCSRKEATVMTTCVGSLWLAAAGVCEGRRVTVNRPAILVGKKMYPGTEWVDQRWVVDGRGEGRCELWTSGGAFAGVDMMATYVLEHFPKDVAMASCMALDVDPTARGQFYSSPPPWEMTGAGNVGVADKVEAVKV